MMCTGIVLGIALLWCPAPAPTDSFCLTYNQIIQKKGDSSIKAPLAVKQRILANELFYKKHCSRSQ